MTCFLTALFDPIQNFCLYPFPQLFRLWGPLKGGLLPNTKCSDGDTASVPHKPDKKYRIQNTSQNTNTNANTEIQLLITKCSDGEGDLSAKQIREVFQFFLFSLSLPNLFSPQSRICCQYMYLYFGIYFKSWRKYGFQNMKQPLRVWWTQNRALPLKCSSL